MRQRLNKKAFGSHFPVRRANLGDAAASKREVEMGGRPRGRNTAKTFGEILRTVAGKNALRLMERAQTANRLAKSLRGGSRRHAYAIKTEALIGLVRMFPEHVIVLNDAKTPRYVRVKKRRLLAMQGPRTMPTAHRVIQGIEAVRMIRKAQLLGSQRTNLATTSIAFALLLKIA